MTTRSSRDRRYGPNQIGGRPLPPLTPEEKERHEKFLAEVREANKESRVQIGDAIKKAVHEALEAARDKAKVDGED